MRRRFAGNSGNSTQSLSYNPASQITSETRDNDAFAFPTSQIGSVDRAYAANSLNQYTSAGPVTFSYDANGNLTSDGSRAYSYDAENRLVSAVSGGVTTNLAYDPLGRLFQVDQGTTATATRFLYDGAELAAEYNGSNAMTKRYYFGPGNDEPMIEDTGGALNCSGTKFLHTNQQGSIIALADCWGNQTNVSSYDEYGIPASNTGRFQYTGQMWLGELGMYYYKNRVYSPTLGRFLQTDPIGYDGDGPNLYAYVLNDPVNSADPLGLDQYSCQNGKCQDIDVVHCTNGGTAVPISAGVYECVPPLVDRGIARDNANHTGGDGGKATNDPHDYRISRRLTKRNTKCTLTDVSKAVNENSVPGSPGPHVSGSVYRVSTFLGFSPGHIQFQASDDGRTFANVTMDDHVLRYGSVVTTITGNQTDGFVANVVGSGSNTSALMAWVNKEIGPPIFAMQLSDMQMAVLSACGG